MADIDNLESRLAALEAYIPPGGGLLVTAVGLNAMLQPIKDALANAVLATGQLNDAVDGLNNGVSGNTGSISDLQNTTDQAASDLQDALDALNAAIGQMSGLGSLIDSEGNARVDGDNANTGAVLSLQDLFDGVRRWSQDCTPTTALPDKLRNSDGTWPLTAGASYLYECEAATDTGEDAVAEFSFVDGEWEVKKISESATTGTAPEFIVDVDGDPAIRPYDSTDVVHIAVQIERHNSQNTVGAANAAAIAHEAVIRSDGDNQMASTIDLIGAKNGDGTAFVLNQGTAQVAPGTTLAQYISGVQSDIGDVSAAVVNEKNARVGGDNANASSIAGVSVTANNALGTANSAASVAAVAQATANAVTGKVNASYTVTLDVNGYVSGIVAQNNGATSSFTVAADKFSIVKPGGGAALTWQNGLLVNTNGAVMTVIGAGFGASHDLMEWYGPAMAVSACTKANALTWKDTSGSAYFGGTLSAGTLKNAVTTTVVSANASVETGAFGTNGKSKVVVCSLSYRNIGRFNTSLGNSATAATVVLQRSYNGGAWTTIGTLSATGTRSSVWEPEFGNYTIDVSCAGTITVTDNYAGLGTFNYRATITSATGWPVTVNGGSTGSQSLSVVSTEQ